MNFADLKLTSGYPVQLQLLDANSKPQKYACKLVGYLPNKGVLVTPPQAGGKFARMVGGQKLTARVMVANGMCVFNTSVETLTPTPYPILHLSYPSSVTFKGVRNATRVDVRLTASATNESSLESVTLNGVVADISVTGARLELTDAIGDVGDELLLKAEASIGPITRTLVLRAVIRSRIERSTREYDENLPAVYGVEFIEKDDDKLLALYAYVYVEMANEDIFSS